MRAPSIGPTAPAPPAINYEELAAVMGNVMMNVLDHREHQKQMEEAAKPKPPPVTVQHVAEPATPEPDYKAQFEEEDKMGVPLNVADKPFSLMEKEPIAIITAVVTILAIGAQWFGVSISASEIDELVIGLNSMVTAGLMLAGVVAGLIARSKVNSPATVAKAKKEGQL